MDASEYRTDQEEQLDMTLNELFTIHEADVTGELLLKAGWSGAGWFLTGWNHIRNIKVKREI